VWPITIISMVIFCIIIAICKFIYKVVCQVFED
jgi:hypothetical protein